MINKATLEEDVELVEKFKVPSAALEPINLQFIKERKKRRHYRAFLNWFTKYEPPINATNIEQIKGYLESFYHLSEVKDWGRAYVLLLINSNNFSPNTALYEHLGIWGYYSNRI